LVDQEEILVYQPPSEFERNTMFLDEMKHFLDCIHGLTEPVVSLEDGIAALRIALGARQSSEDRCRIRIKGDSKREFST
jgi:predicted dehydrogenase